MRQLCAIACVLVLPLLIMGCTEEKVLGREELSPPLGLQSITGDEKVTLSWWCSNFESDLNGYIIYYRQGAFGGDPRENVPSGFQIVDSLEVTPPSADEVWIDIEGLQNGVTYSFVVVAAKGDWGEISHTSNIIEDTPRDETATEVQIMDYHTTPALAGFELSDFTVVSCVDLHNYTTGSGLGDIMCERFNPGAGMRAWVDGINGGEVQDLGYMSDWDGADEAPLDGYADTGHSVEALLGHVYAIKTGNNHYAKIQITGVDLNHTWIRLKAAYQPDPGNPEYR